jgi:hypothetical protein
MGKCVETHMPDETTLKEESPDEFKVRAERRRACRVHIAECPICSQDDKPLCDKGQRLLSRTLE